MQEQAGIPLIGEAFPQMRVDTTLGQLTLPDDMTGKWFLLFSHPADFTPVCTTEFVAFQKRIEQFRELNCEIIALSIDQIFSHIKWVQWINDNLDTRIEFPIIADDTGRVAKRLGMIHPGKATNTVRAVFTVDSRGVIRAMLYYPQEIGRNIDELLRALRALQTSDSEGVALPAGWPENELIGDEVIIPPAKDYNTAMERAGSEDCYDWWFCHKKL